MLSFKEFVYEGPLTQMFDKHTDPFKFALNVTKAQQAGKLKITRSRGAANTRELVAAFLRHKKRKTKRKATPT